jgi:hypothetical protein
VHRYIDVTYQNNAEAIVEEQNQITKKTLFLEEYMDRLREGDSVNFDNFKIVCHLHRSFEHF